MSDERGLHASHWAACFNFRGVGPANECHKTSSAYSTCGVARRLTLPIMLTLLDAAAATAPSPRLNAKHVTQGDLVATVEPLLKRHGYVLPEGLEPMTAEETRSLMRSIGGTSSQMLRFGECGDSCASPDVPEVRVLGRGVPNALLADIGYQWHQDGGGTAPFLTLLHCKQACAGADTLFALPTRPRRTRSALPPPLTPTRRPGARRHARARAYEIKGFQKLA